MAKYILTLVCLISTISAFYEEGSSKVERLTGANFQSKVLDSDEIWYVEYYAPWCGHCKSLAPHWDTAAKKLKGVVKLGAIDIDDKANSAIGQKYGIQGFPSLKIFGLNKKDSPTDYTGGRDADSIVKHAANTAQKEVLKRLKGADTGSSSGGSKSSSSGSSGGSGGSGGGASGNDVVVLNEGNFDRLVLGSKDIWIVEFYAPWCGHCKALEPEYKIAATKLKGQVKLGMVDADAAENKALAGRFGVSGFPTLKVFDYGNDKTVQKAYDYKGERTSAGLIAFGSELADAADIDPEVHELVKQNVYDENCKGAVICVITFLPNIYDSNAAERKRYLDTLMNVAKKNRKSPFNHFWLQSGDQLDLERSLNLGFGFPAMIVVSPGKKMFGTMRSSFNQVNINEWLGKLLSGSGGGLEKLPVDIKIKKADKWDGKDAPVFEEEDYTEYEDL